MKRITNTLSSIRFVALRSLAFAILLIFTGISPVSALSTAQKKVWNSGVHYFNTEKNLCGGTGIAPGSNGQLGPTFDGHTLPAAVGGAGMEEAASLKNGRAVLSPGTSNPGAGLALAPAGMTQNDVTYYMNMRWRYALWAWDGTSTNKGAPENATWYTQTVRKVLITNPKTGKSVVAAILESGPAPWTGTKAGSASRHNPPLYWHGYVDGTPVGYDGRVAGLSPATFAALGDPNMQWANGGQSGYALNYSWADQSLPSGTVTQGTPSPDGSTGPTNSSPCPGLGTPAGIENFVFYSQTDQRWASQAYGDSTIAESGCGPSSVAMVVATLSDQSITPKEVTDFANANNMYVPGAGSSWTLMTEGPKNWGLKSAEIGTDLNAAAAVIRAGGLVIATGKGPVPFTTGGHIIVLRGVDENGSFLVGDPAHQEANTKAYTPSELAGSINNMWGVTK